MSYSGGGQTDFSWSGEKTPWQSELGRETQFTFGEETPTKKSEELTLEPGVTPVQKEEPKPAAPVILPREKAKISLTRRRGKHVSVGPGFVKFIPEISKRHPLARSVYKKKEFQIVSKKGDIVDLTIFFDMIWKKIKFGVLVSEFEQLFYDAMPKNRKKTKRWRLGFEAMMKKAGFEFSVYVTPKTKRENPDAVEWEVTVYI